MLDSGFRPPPEYDLENDFDILPDSDEEDSDQGERIWSEKEFNSFCFKKTTKMIPELVPNLYTEYSSHLSAQPSHVYADSFESSVVKTSFVSKRIDHFKDHFLLYSERKFRFFQRPYQVVNEMKLETVNIIQSLS